MSSIRKTGVAKCCCKAETPLKPKFNPRMTPKQPGNGPNMTPQVGPMMTMVSVPVELGWCCSDCQAEQLRKHSREEEKVSQLQQQGWGGGWGGGVGGGAKEIGGRRKERGADKSHFHRGRDMMERSKFKETNALQQCVPQSLVGDLQSLANSQDCLTCT